MLLSKNLADIPTIYNIRTINIQGPIIKILESVNLIELKNALELKLLCSS